MKVATQHVAAPGARSIVYPYPPVLVVKNRLVDQSLTSKKTVPAAATCVSANSDTEHDQHSEPGSSTSVSDNQGKLSHRDTPEDEELDQELSEVNYNKTTEGRGCLWGGTRYWILTPPHHLWTTIFLLVPEPN